MSQNTAAEIPTSRPHSRDGKSLWTSTRKPTRTFPSRHTWARSWNMTPPFQAMRPGSFTRSVRGRRHCLLHLRGSHPVPPKIHQLVFQFAHPVSSDFPLPRPCSDPVTLSPPRVVPPSKRQSRHPYRRPRPASALSPRRPRTRRRCTTPQSGRPRLQFHPPTHATQPKFFRPRHGHHCGPSSVQNQGQVPHCGARCTVGPIPHMGPSTRGGG